MQVFLSDLRKYELDYEERDERCAVKGVPVLRSGTWRGIPFGKARLAEIASSFTAIKQADDWMPPVRPRHPSKEEWANDTWDTTQNLGVVEALNYDPEADVLFADIEVDAGTGEKMRGGNVRYVSSEFTDYRSPNTGAVYEDAFRGVAFVDNPAVKNIGWLSALNAEEFRGGTEMRLHARTTEVLKALPASSIGTLKADEALLEMTDGLVRMVTGLSELNAAGPAPGSRDLGADAVEGQDRIDLEAGLLFIVGLEDNTGGNLPNSNALLFLRRLVEHALGQTSTEVLTAQTHRRSPLLVRLDQKLRGGNPWSEANFQPAGSGKKTAAEQRPKGGTGPWSEQNYQRRD